MKRATHCEIAIVGCGFAGISTAYFLCREFGARSVVLIDREAPMAYTSAQSGDNYRNWWPSPTMTALTNHSIDLLESIARETDNVFAMGRRGYLLASRRNDLNGLLDDLSIADAPGLRVNSPTYRVAAEDAWEYEPDGIDVLTENAVQGHFPSLDDSVRTVVHLRRAGDISGQQLGQYMLDRVRESGGKRVTGDVVAIDHNNHFALTLDDRGERAEVHANTLVNAAGPFVGDIADMLGTSLPVDNIYQQKIAFEDTRAVVPRDLPFAIDLDDVRFEWSDEEREFLASDASTAWLTQTQRGGAHCRPEGAHDGQWVKLGWAFNREVSQPQRELPNEPLQHPNYLEIVLRAAARLQPRLAEYLDNFPTRFSHYGGYYTMTDENWPLVGPMNDVPNAFVAGALSGFGSMACCAVGQLAAGWITGASLPDYAAAFAPSRYTDPHLVAELSRTGSRGVL